MALADNIYIPYLAKYSIKVSKKETHIVITSKMQYMNAGSTTWDVMHTSHVVQQEDQRSLGFQNLNNANCCGTL
jgi:hypothetical protein